MATIIKKGTKEKVEKTIVYDVWEIKCDRCGCVFEAEQKEFRSECGLEIILCPQCGRTLDAYRWEYSKKKTKKKTIQIMDIIDSLQEESASDLEEAATSFARKDSEGISNPANFYYTVADKARIFKAGTKWQKEKINEVLLSEVLPCFMHGGEADEVVAKLEEVLNKK